MRYELMVWSHLALVSLAAVTFIVSLPYPKAPCQVRHTRRSRRDSLNRGVSTHAQ